MAVKLLKLNVFRREFEEENKLWLKGCVVGWVVWKNGE